MPRVKICGNRSLADVSISVGSGADAIGLIVGARHRTEDELQPEAAAILLKSIPVYVHSVLVTHLVTAREVLSLHDHVPTTVIQLQDEILPREISKIRDKLPSVRLIKAISVTDRSAITRAEEFSSAVDALLLDSRTEDRIGGTGQVHDWQISREIVANSNKPVILAGGLTPENLKSAIEIVRPHAVDVNSGVEFLNGDKDPARVRAFVQIANGCEIEGQEDET